MTNVESKDNQEMMADAEAGDLDAVVVLSVYRICRSIADGERTAVPENLYSTKIS